MSVGFCRGSRVRYRGSRVEDKKNFFREVYIKILSNNRLRLIRCLLYGKQENSFHETVLYQHDELNLILLKFTRPVYCLFFLSGFLAFFGSFASKQ